MCRALLYLGQPVLLDNLLFQPDSALIRQSTMPRMLHMLNLAGFGIRAWDPASANPGEAYSYYSQSLPVFDRNLQNLARKIRPSCVLGHVRGVAYSSRVEISLQNVHPFHFAGVRVGGGPREASPWRTSSAPLTYETSRATASSCANGFPCGASDANRSSPCGEVYTRLRRVRRD